MKELSILMRPYRITENLPENLKISLPTIEELELEFSKELPEESKDLLTTS